MNKPNMFSLLSFVKKIRKFFSQIFEIGWDPGDAGIDFDDVLGF